MTTRPLTLFIISTAIAAGSLFFPNSLLAAPADSACDLEAKLETLISVRDNLTLSPAQKSNQETTARRDLLAAILYCSLSESQDIKIKLSNLNDLNLSPEDKTIKDWLLLNLTDFSDYYQSQTDLFIKIKNNPAEIKTLAVAVASWRASVYNPLITDAVNFIFLTRQSEIISVADIRLHKIKTSLSSLLSINDKRVNELLIDASAKIIRSKELETAARRLISQKILSRIYLLQKCL